jgi:TPR repeat protein
MYKYGHYVEKNYEKAFEYYQKSADLSNPMALNNLGLMYKNGEYVEQNYRKAFECFHKSASLGGVVALNNIKNLCYDSDNDVKNAAKKYLENSKYNKKSGKKDDIKEMEKILEQKNKLIKILRKKDVDKDKKIYKLENIIENLLMELDYTSEYQRRAIWEEKKID